MSNQDWELKVVENAGEIPAEDYPEGITVPVKPLLLDIKTQLMFEPKRYVYTVGWRAYVWQKKEGGIFKDLNASEYNELIKRGTVSYTRETDGDSGSSAPVTSGEASTS
jgi:hypothetical protein